MNAETFGRQMLAAIKGYVARSLVPLQTELAGLQARLEQIPAGAKGDDGPVGGRGEKGEQGGPGRDGRDGKDGANGRDGIDGKDGANGQDGKDGADGLNGKDGAPGLNGKDGSVLIDFRTLAYDMDTRELVFTCAMSDGQERHLRAFAPLPVYRGVLRSGMTAKQGEIYTWGGSMWQAKRDTTKAPPGDDWICCVQRGKDGKDAE